MDRHVKIMAVKVLAALAFISGVSLFTAILGFTSYEPGGDLLPAAIGFVAFIIFIFHWIVFCVIVADLIHRARRAREN